MGGFFDRLDVDYASCSVIDLMSTMHHARGLPFCKIAVTQCQHNLPFPNYFLFARYDQRKLLRLVGF